jgi:hypothetical protein
LKENEIIHLVDVAILGEGVMEIDHSTHGSRPNPAQGSNSRNFASFRQDPRGR